MHAKLVFVAVLFAPIAASAHISMTSPSRRTSEQKQRHCGLTAATRANVSTHAPGATITVTWNETISHTGWYRISFHPDGDVFRIPPASNGPCGSGAICNFPTEDFTGMTDPGGSIVLLDRIMDNTGLGSYSQQITLPNIECTNCTLQLIQLMTSGHGMYTTDALSDDIYFQCADLILSASAPDAAPGTPDAAGGPGQDAPGNPGGGVGGGCSAANGSSGILMLLALAGLRRRRRSA